MSGYFTYGGDIKSFETLIDSFKRIKQKNRTYCYMGAAQGIIGNSDIGKMFMQKYFEKIEKEHKKYFYPILGWYLLRQDRQSDIQPTEKKLIYRGLGPFLYFESNFQMSSFNEMMKPIPQEYRSACFEGIGMSLTSFHKRNFLKVQNTIDELSSDDKVSAYRGVGRSIGERFGFNTKSCEEMINKVEPKYQNFCYEGLGKQVAWRFGKNKEVINLILKGIDQKFKIFFERGIQEELKYSN